MGDVVHFNLVQMAKLPLRNVCQVAPVLPVTSVQEADVALSLPVLMVDPHLKCAPRAVRVLEVSEPV